MLPSQVSTFELPAERFPDAVEATVYYVVAEALTNAQRHASAASIRIRVTHSRGFLRATVVDDGVGGATEASGSGLAGLRDRVEAMGGRFSVTSLTRVGTIVTAAHRGRSSPPWGWPRCA